MIQTDKEKMIEALVKLKKAHHIYCKANEEQRGRLLESCQFLIDRLVGFGYEREFVESLLIGGKEFLDSWHSKVRGTPKELEGVEAGEVIFK